MIDPSRYGISFSLKQCRNFDLDPHATLDWLLAQGWRRFRLMSYWDEHETERGTYDFSELDWQLTTIALAGGTVTLSVGAKQPRWPEYHWPTWAWEASKPDRDAALLRYISYVVERYRHSDCITSYQLENEALLQGFGERIEIDRSRLRREYACIKALDPTRPIAMSTSNGWGVPLRRPLPDRVGFSYYPIMYANGAYHRTIQRPWLHRIRRSIIHVVLGKPVFIHELQCEPWGPTAIWNMDVPQQAISMGPQQIRRNIALARRIKTYPIDLWGAEWWYWRYLQGDSAPWQAVAESLRS
jgi:hypothetical protein